MNFLIFLLTHCIGSYINDPVYHDILFISKLCSPVDTDSKFFVDLELTKKFEDIKKELKNLLSKYQTDVSSIKQSFLTSNFDLDLSLKEDIIKFLNKNFKESTDILVPVTINHTEPTWVNNLTEIQQNMCRRIFELWKMYYKRSNYFTDSDQCSLLDLSGNFCVLGGRFNEMYYWDTYWIILGLIDSNMINEAYEIIKTFVKIINKYEFIPNGTRTYYLNRSQPPFFTQMLDVLYKSTKDKKIHKYILNEGLAAAEQEYNFFMTKKSISYEDVIFNVYSVDTNTPRLESYTEDLITHSMCKEKNKIYNNLATGAESGWDFLSRWLQDGKNLQTINIKDIIPVDLNSILMKNEIIIKNFYLKKHEEFKIYRSKIFEYSFNIEKRRKCMKMLWNNNENCWNDLNVITGKFNDTRFYFSNLFPLFFTENTKEDIYAILKNYHKELFGYIGGVPISSDGPYTGLQWDFPNVWAPCIQLLVEFLGLIDEDFAIHGCYFFLSISKIKISRNRFVI